MMSRSFDKIGAVIGAIIGFLFAWLISLLAQEEIEIEETNEQEEELARE